MVYTVTLNPSLDYVMHLPQLVSGRVNRSVREDFYPGGKGINVSIMLARLGVESRALGFTAGFTGRRIAYMLRECGCEADFIVLEDGESRINVKVRADAETDLNGCGPPVPPHALKILCEKLSALGADDLLVLAGSIPGGMPPDIYHKILARLDGRGVGAVVDATGALLLETLAYRPFLIKPNIHELGELTGETLHTAAEAAERAADLQARGARNVLVSMGGAGAILLDETGRLHESSAPKGTVRGAVGAGDSMVAGFLAGWLGTRDYTQAFRLGLAAGSATAFSDWLASGQAVKRLLESSFPKE